MTNAKITWEKKQQEYGEEKEVEGHISECHQHIDNVMSCGVGQKNPAGWEKFSLDTKCKRCLLKSEILNL